MGRRVYLLGWTGGRGLWQPIERDPVDLANELESLGARTVAIEADFADTGAPAMAFMLLNNANWGRPAPSS